MPKALIPILAITFVDILGFTILIPILPFYAEHYGASPVVVGSLVTTVALSALVAAPIWGRFSDRLGRKRVLLVSQLTATLAYLLLGIGGSLAVVFAARAIEGIGGGTIGVTQAYVSDVTEPKDRARAFALVGATFGSGFIFGPAVGGALVRYGYSVPFFTAAAVSLVTVSLTIVMLPESYRPLGPTPRLPELIEALRAPRLSNVLLQQFFFALAFTLWVSVFALFVERVLRFGPSQTSALYAVSGVVGVLAQVTLVGRLVDRFGERNVTFAGFVLAIVAFGLVAAVSDLAKFLAVLVLWSLAGSLVRPALAAMVSQAAPSAQRGSVMGISDSLTNLAFVIGPMISTSILSWNVHCVGILPAASVIVAFLIGLAGKRQPAITSKAATEPAPGA